MQFQMLGPLEVTDGNKVLGLGGTRQRATLGFLLLNFNRVVATSQLLDALWTDEAPVSARKILQNAVWGLRGVLTKKGDSEGSATLVTQTPGYMLNVNPEQVDLHEFQRLVEQGRARLASHEFEEASRILRQALALWRGPVLADLVETGLVWPELSVLENLRLDVQEDFFEAELNCGRHHAVLGELERMVASHPLRERSGKALMLALYRCGRQADALNVFSRVRTALVDELGLEPGRELRQLQQAILTHDETLTFTPPRSEPAIPTRLVAPPAPEPEIAEPAPVAPYPSQVPAQRKHVSVLMVRSRLDVSDNADPFDLDDVLHSVSGTIRRDVEYFGGTIAASIGSVTLALFDAPRQAANNAERAVLAALAIRDCLSASLAKVNGVRVVPHAAVTTGEALVRYQITEQGALTINGTPVEQCQAMLAGVPGGETWISDSTRAEIERVVPCREVSDVPGLWQVDGGRRDIAIPPNIVPVVDREPELELLRGLMDRTQHRATLHLVTVLGTARVGKTRFLVEFQRRVVGHPTTGQFVLVHAYRPNQRGVSAVQAEILASCCGIQRDDGPHVVRQKLATTARRYLDTAPAKALLRLLDPLDPEAGATEETTAAWHQLIAAVARERGLVMVIDDLHCADDEVLAFIENLTESVGPVPLLIITAARPELLDRRPDWSGGRRHATTFTLDPLSDEAIDRLLELLLSSAGTEHIEIGDTGHRLPQIVSERLDTRRKYVRMMLCQDRRMLIEPAAGIRSN